MAIRACDNPRITSSVLSREINKLVIVHAEAEVRRLLHKRKADAARGLISFARGDGRTWEAREGEVSKRKRCHGGAANEVSPISEAEETHAASTPTRPRAQLTASYLRGGPTEFERKVTAKIKVLMASGMPSPPIPMTAVLEEVVSESLVTTKAAHVATATAAPTMPQPTAGSLCQRTALIKEKIKPVCIYEGCTNLAQRRGLCGKHARKTKQQICQVRDCTSKVVNMGVCSRHGARRPICSRDGCAKYAVKGGVCVMHGATPIRKRCTQEGCNNYSIRRGLCASHGANR